MELMSRINSTEIVYRNILAAKLQRNVSKLIGGNFIRQQDNNPKITIQNKYTANITKDFI